MGENIVNVYGSLASIDCQASAVTYGVSTTYKGIRTPVTRKKYLMHVKTGKVDVLSITYRHSRNRDQPKNNQQD